MFECVMIVDDSGMDRCLSEKVVEANGFAQQVVSFSLASAALSYLRSLHAHPQHFPGIILLDVNMPGMDGFDFLDQFLEFPQDLRKKCAVYMISATTSPHELARIKTYPVVRKFYSKPLTGAILNEIQAHSEHQLV